MKTVFTVTLAAGGPRVSPWVEGMEKKFFPGTEYQADQYSGDSYRVVDSQGTVWFINKADLIVLSSAVEFDGDGTYVHSEYTIDALGIA